MNEAQRQFLLGMAGVRVWYARSPLPGAAPSPVFLFPEPQAEESHADVALKPKDGHAQAQAQAIDRRFARPQRERIDPEAAERGARRLAGLQQLISGQVDKAPLARADAEEGAARQSATDLAAQADSVRGESAVRRDEGPGGEVSQGNHASQGAAAGSATVTERAEQVRIEGHWGIWRAGHWCLVSELATDASRALEHRLAVAILAALRDELVECRELRWPVFSHPELHGGGVEGLKDTLQRLGKDMKIAHGKPERILFLNSRGPSASASSQTLEALLETGWGMPVCHFGESLAALAGDPALKRSLWELLRPLMAVGQE